MSFSMSRTWCARRGSTPPQITFPNDDEIKDLIPDALNRFFSEAQWESYCKLGEHIGHSVFADPCDSPRGEWSPYKELSETGQCPARPPAGP